MQKGKLEVDSHNKTTEERETYTKIPPHSLTTTPEGTLPEEAERECGNGPMPNVDGFRERGGEGAGDIPEGGVAGRD